MGCDATSSKTWVEGLSQDSTLVRQTMSTTAMSYSTCATDSNIAATTVRKIGARRQRRIAPL